MDNFEDARLAIAKGRRATEELGIVDEAFGLLRQAALDAIVNSHPREHDLRERAIVTAQIIDAVREQLKNIETQGEAEAAMNQLLRESDTNE